MIGHINSDKIQIDTRLIVKGRDKYFTVHKYKGESAVAKQYELKRDISRIFDQKKKL